MTEQVLTEIESHKRTIAATIAGEARNAPALKPEEMTVRAAFVPSSINAEERTVEVVFATETPVRKMTWDGPVLEVLGFADGEVDMTRMQSGAPVLDNHSRWGSVSNNVIGVVENARIEQGSGVATLRFSKRESVEDIFQDIRDGILRNVSVGYSVEKYEITRADGQLDSYRAISWTPMEVSMVAVPADHNAQTRSLVSDNDTARAADFSPTKNSNMEPTTKQEQAAPNAEQPAPVVDEQAVRASAVAEERSRVQAIQTAVRAAKLDDSLAAKMIDDGTSADQARAAVIEALAKGQEETRTNPAHTAKLTGTDEVEKRKMGAVAALTLRSAASSAVKKLTDEEKTHARQFNGLSLVELAKDCLVRAGENVSGLDRMEIAGRAISSSTSDFPVILEGTIRRILLAEYSIAQDTWRRFCAVGSVSDFREHSRLRTGSLSRLEKVNENAKYRNKAIPDAEKERIIAETYGNTINVSRKMIINDDLAAFTRLANQLGRAAARSIEIDVYSLFALNGGNGPIMGDGQALFHGTHANIGTNSLLTVAGLEADRVLMAVQKDVSGNDFLDLRPSVLVVPVGLGGTARVLNEAQFDPDATGQLQRPNQVVGLFNDIVDTPRLAGTVRYLFADPSIEPVFEVAFLNGVETPFMEMQEQFTVDGMVWKVRHDYGFGAIGWRGVVRNAGTE